MARLFGTDGVRGTANKDITADFSLRLAQAAAVVLAAGARERGERPRAVIAKDPRVSSDFISAAVSAGLASSGVDVFDAGVIPTPACAYLTADLGADFGVMISASHNAAPDNGIKFFSHGGHKLQDSLEDEIEKAMGQMMAALKQRLGADKILLANNAYSSDAKHVYPVSDAIMFENYATVKSSKESLLFEWEQMLRNAKAGKISVFRLGVEGTGRRNLKPNMPKLSQEKSEFALACYLIGAQPYSYFMYSWGWKLSSGALVDYPNFKKPLGPPKNAYKRTTPGGWEFTRDFEHASVWVNTESRQAKITWR